MAEAHVLSPKKIYILLNLKKINIYGYCKEIFLFNHENL